MKKWWLNGILVVAVLILIIPSIFIKTIPAGTEEPDPAPIVADSVIITISEVEDITIGMYHHPTKEIVEMPLEQYVLGVVSGEMPASFHLEALKAQAVAARTLAVYKMLSFGGRGCNQKEGADVCSSFAHCQEWISEEDKKRNWGSDYADNLKKIQQAVAETRGEIIKYKNRPIEVLYHSTSNGKTEDSGEVFSTSLPYYKVVESFGEEDFSKYNNRVTITNKKFVETFKKRYPSSSLKESNLSNQVKINGYTESGRVKGITLGGVTLKGTEFRMLYGLYSADFTLSFGKDAVTIDTTGFGHGVGMSQVGADRMAKRGYGYNEILMHYYQGVNIEKYQLE